MSEKQKQKELSNLYEHLEKQQAYQQAYMSAKAKFTEVGPLYYETD